MPRSVNAVASRRRRKKVLNMDKAIGAQEVKFLRLLKTQ